VTDLLELLPLDKLHPAPDNPRAGLGDVAELAASIRAVGLAQPLLVTPDGAGGYTVVAGHRRLAAAGEAGLADVPCVVRDLTDEQRAELMLVENLQRADLTPLEEADAFARLEALGWAQRRIAERIGKSQAHVSKRLALRRLPDAVRVEVDSGGITLGDAAELVRLADHPDRIVPALEDARRYGGDAARAIDAQLADVARLEKRAAALAKLHARKGLSVIDLPHVRAGWGGLPDGRRVLGKGYGDLHIGVREHAKGGCHAAAVLHDGEVVYVCTKPANHKPAGKADDEEKQRAKAERERKRQLADAAAARAALAHRVLARRLTPKAILDHVAAHALATCSYQVAERACTLLGVAVEKGGDAQEELRGWAVGSGDRAHRAGLAIALAGAEEWMSGEWRHWPADPQVALHLAWLEAHGHELADVERDKLDGKP
jgi:ParB/RepB/Spo0J family partition protein